MHVIVQLTSYFEWGRLLECSEPRGGCSCMPGEFCHHWRMGIAREPHLPTIRTTTQIILERFMKDTELWAAVHEISRNKISIDAIFVKYYNLMLRILDIHSSRLVMQSTYELYRRQSTYVQMKYTRVCAFVTDGSTCWCNVREYFVRTGVRAGAA